MEHTNVESLKYFFHAGSPNNGREKYERELNRHRRDVSFEEINNHRFVSLDLNRRKRRWSVSFEECRSPSHLLLPPSEDKLPRIEKEDDFIRTTDLGLSSLSADRRRRRYKSSVRKDGRSEREK